MLPFFFRHYDSFVSKYFIFDDNSVDDSVELMRGHPNVEVAPLLRCDPDSFALSELSISNECWRRSRGRADWVIIVDIDEHLFHPDLPALLMRYKALGITIVPALGYQMISETFPQRDGMLCETHTNGAPWDLYSKLALFDPSAIIETNFGVGRHTASPTGRVIAPCHDELLLLHYKFLGFDRTYARHQQQRCGLGTKDLENGWGYQYSWSEEEFRQTWDEFAQNVIDVRSDAAVGNNPIKRWWDSFRLLVAEPQPQIYNIEPEIKQEETRGGYPVEGNSIISSGIPALSPVSFWVPDYICTSAWIEHAPFAFWLCEALRPRRFVELGTHYGYSYFAFCQAIERLGLGTAAYAIDTWKGDEHAGFYDESVFRSVVIRNDDKYAAFSSLIRSTFEDALDYFTDGSIDLLHIDGRHFYDDVEEDFTLWRAKLTENAVVLIHDTNVREREFGVWKFFEKAATQYPSFQFFHGYGLGLLIPGHRVPIPLVPLVEARLETAHQIRAVYATLGGSLKLRAAVGDRRRDIETEKAEHPQSLREIESLKALTETIANERDAAVKALKERDHEIQAQKTEHEQLLGKIESLKALMATTASERDEAAAAVAAGREALISSRASLVERDEALTEMSRRTDELVAALTSADEKLAKLDGALSRAERELSERNAAVEVLQSKITSLLNNLAAARDVGGVAFAALRTEATTVPQAPATPGRLVAVRRRLSFRGRTRLDRYR
jgi:hypothetical protein